MMTIEESKILAIKILGNLVHYQDRKSHYWEDVQYLADNLLLLANTTK